MRKVLAEIIVIASCFGAGAFLQSHYSSPWSLIVVMVAAFIAGIGFAIFEGMNDTR